ncbi:apoptosis inhibitory protein 5-domain-containing protein [Chytridium lagenaria]|nr:apoptosis inhibitory protein 5-domain-containing protein [Chytridium lagenaria]
MSSSPDEFYAATSRLMDITLKNLKPGKEEEVAYNIVLSAVSNVALKRLATTAIPKYFVHFPNCQDLAMESHLDLCEDDDAKIRHEAIRGLPLLCKDTPRFVAKVADVLCQLLQTDDKMEEKTVRDSLIACWLRSPRATCAAVFQQAIAGMPEVRKRAVRFILSGITSPTKETFITISDPIFAAQFAADITKLLQFGNLDADDAKLVLGAFSEVAVNVSLDQAESVLGVYVAAIDTPKPFEASSVDSVSKLVACIHSSIGFYKKGAKSTAFLSFIVRKVLNTVSFSAFPSDLKRTQVLRIASDAMKWGVDGKLLRRRWGFLKGCLQFIPLRMQLHTPIYPFFPGSVRLSSH